MIPETRRDLCEDLNSDWSKVGIWRFDWFDWFEQIPPPAAVGAGGVHGDIYDIIGDEPAQQQEEKEVEHGDEREDGARHRTAVRSQAENALVQ